MRLPSDKTEVDMDRFMHYYTTQSSSNHQGDWVEGSVGQKEVVAQENTGGRREGKTNAKDMKLSQIALTVYLRISD
jgi:hypothetical protein